MTCEIPPKSPTEVLAEASRLYGVDVSAICDGDRRSWVHAARKAVARTLHSYGMPLVEIGRLLGGRDHSTVGYMLRPRKARRLQR